MLAAKLLAGGGTETLYAEDVFSAYTYTGNGSTQTITNGIDLSGSGGLVWTKNRSNASSNSLVDTTRGVHKYIQTNSTAAEGTSSATVTAFSSTGFSIGSDGWHNASSQTYVSWTFRKAERFFDVVTWTGDGAAGGRTIEHSLASSIGCIITKRTNDTAGWAVWHRGTTSGNYLVLNDTAAQTTSAAVNRFGNDTITVDPTSASFTVGSVLNTSAITYVAYLFAHDTGTDGLIQCGSFTTDGSGNATVSLGWEPQYVTVKASSAVGNWITFDSMRGMPADATSSWLYPNTSGAEASTAAYKIKPNATGMAPVLEASTTYIYLAIRRPNKPPTTGTQVYNAIARTGTGAAATVTGVGFAPDLAMPHRGSINGQRNWFDRLRGAQNYFNTSEGSAESLVSNGYGLIGFDEMDGVRVGTGTDGYVNQSGTPYINHFFKRAPGVFDVVCYTGTGSATTVAHGLGAVPELMIVKGRGNSNNWEVYYGNPTTAARISLNTTTSNAHFSGLFNDTAPTASVFTVGTSSSTNQVSINFVAYLFATLAGISKVFSYTGNGGTAGSAGTSQTINCGFTTGARFVMLKCTSHTSDWVVVDTTRGLIAGNDPALSLNTTAAEVTTTDLFDPDTSGFIVNQLATGTTSADFNVTGRTYIGLAFS